LNRAQRLISDLKKGQSNVADEWKRGTSHTPLRGRGKEGGGVDREFGELGESGEFGLVWG